MADDCGDGIDGNHWEDGAGGDIDDDIYMVAVIATLMTILMETIEKVMAMLVMTIMMTLMAAIEKVMANVSDGNIDNDHWKDDGSGDGWLWGV